jgi:DNA-binding transcriptional ArsR family regulator
MVNFQDRTLDRTFSALADPTRRMMLAELDGRQDISVSELARPFAMSLPAIMKHLDVLSDAGLITRTKTGRTVSCRLTAAPMEQAMNWLARYERFWPAQIDRLAAFVEKDSWPTPTSRSKPSRASPSSAASARRAKKSTRPGPTRKK